jgi:hypothetical protein
MVVCWQASTTGAGEATVGVLGFLNVLCCVCRRNERARAFLSLLRQSQLYEVFIQERLQMAASCPGGPEASGTCTCSQV